MDSNYILTSDGQLFHWGIKGMKWGVRRYQNADGSLTTAGRKKYAAESKKLKEREETIKNREKVKARQDKLAAKKADLDAREKALKDAKKSDRSAKIDAIKNKLSKKNVSEVKKKSLTDISDEELQKMVNRARLEDQYKQLRPEPTPKKNKMLAALEPVLIDAGKNIAKSALDKISKQLLGEKASEMPALNTWEDYVKRETYRKAKRQNDDEEKTEKETAAKKAKEDAANAKAKKEAERKRKEEEREARQREREEAAKRVEGKKAYEYYDRYF